MVWDRDLYLEEACKQLCDDRFSHQIDQDATQAQHKEVTNVIGQAISTCELPPRAKHLTVENPRPRNSTCSLKFIRLVILDVQSFQLVTAQPPTSLPTLIL